MKLELLSNLRQQVMAVFVQKGYQKSCIKRYCNSWNNLQNYMDLYGYKEYSSEIGTEFLMTVMAKGNTMNCLTGRKRLSDI